MTTCTAEVTLPWSEASEPEHHPDRAVAYKHEGGISPFDLYECPHCGMKWPTTVEREARA